ncbi:hypothetical protein [Marinobacterium sp. BA1]|uniref:DUF7230 family protein n=1 Tax=Marinobacterium sp. BA1 TaxID=3138931 RepID=UPI0032E57CE3
MSSQKTDTRNLVAKHARTYNTAARFEDRKKALKRGKVKHKGTIPYQDAVVSAAA